MMDIPQIKIFSTVVTKYASERAETLADEINEWYRSNPGIKVTGREFHVAGAGYVFPRFVQTIVIHYTVQGDDPKK